MDLRGRRVAQIVRDFMEACALSSRIRDGLRSDNLEFAWIERLVGEGEESALYRLKEECHALFRVDGSGSQTELHAGELFDLAVGALFHEGMKFRESYYLTTAYGPRLERMMIEGSASGPLAEAFRRVFDAGHRRMLESESEILGLFLETRDQLLIVLRQMPASGAVARSLVENPARTEAVFGMSLSTLLEQIYRSERRGFELAVLSLLRNGHFAEAAALLARENLEAGDVMRAAGIFARGMASYYAGDLQAAVDSLSGWVSEGGRGDPGWRVCARRVLDSIASGPESLDPALGQRAVGLAEALKPESSG